MSEYGQWIKVTIEDGIATIRLDRPKMNPIDADVQESLGRAAAEHADDVANHCPGGGGDDADALRVGRQRLLALGAEQPFGAEFFLECFEGQAQGAITGRLDGIEDQLVVATPLEQ